VAEQSIAGAFDHPQNLTAASVQPTTLRLTEYFESAYLCEEAFSHMQIIE
jgi:hypothetical protein